ncbi:hypothetical protein CPC08DRAFT_230988 [Agrocybe pediades]|nr:hypothetical protein CPC08DRAFT_230988 [Agrocybe pediades]
MSSIDCLPPEILSHIFRETHSLIPLSISSRAGPLLISQVSRRWRHIAIKDASLWQLVGITILPTTALKHASIVKLWLRRSSRQPLSIAVWVDRFSQLSKKTFQVIRAIFHELASVSDRWESLHLSLPSYGRTLCAEFFASHFPNLQSLTLTLGNWTTEDAWQIKPILQHAPALQKLTWSNQSSSTSFDVPFNCGIKVVPDPTWQTLTDVRLDTCIACTSVLHILRQCQKLVRLDLPHFYGGDIDIREPSSIHLPFLETITIYQLRLNAGLSSLLNHLSCPNLKNFNYTCGYINRTWPQSPFEDFLARSQCNLQSLVLEYTAINESQLMRCLKQTSSSLKTLEVYDARGVTCVTDELLAMLTMGKSMFGEPNDILCPNLQSLALHNVVACTNGALAAALQSRTACGISPMDIACSPLCSVNIRFSKRFIADNEGDIAYLRELAERT